MIAFYTQQTGENLSGCNSECWSGCGSTGFLIYYWQEYTWARWLKKSNFAWWLSSPVPLDMYKGAYQEMRTCVCNSMSWKQPNCGSWMNLSLVSWARTMILPTEVLPLEKTKGNKDQEYLTLYLTHGIYTQSSVELVNGKNHSFWDNVTLWVLINV